jgi:hypothetical protein
LWVIRLDESRWTQIDRTLFEGLAKRRSKVVKRMDEGL